MKVLFMKIRIFFANRHNQRFLLIMFLSFPLTLALTYYTWNWWIDYSHRNDEQQLMQDIIDISEEDRVYQRPVLVEKDILQRRSISNQATTNFWEGTALETRYTVPKRHRP